MTQQEGGTANRPPLFSGSVDTNHQKWWQKWIQYGDYCGWDNAANLRSFPLFFTDDATTWFAGLDDAQKETIPHQQASFNNNYGGQENEWILEASHMSNKQKEGEKVSTYAIRTKDLCTRMGKADRETRNSFVWGLLPGLKEAVMSYGPDTMAEAERRARLIETSGVVANGGKKKGDKKKKRVLKG